MVERAAQVLFEFVFSRSDRLDRKHLWTQCDEHTKDGFRGEARAVIRAAWPFFVGESPPKHGLVQLAVTNETEANRN
jgi:hypothetical protein